MRLTWRGLFKFVVVIGILVVVVKGGYEAIYKSDLIKLKDVVVEGASSENAERIKRRVHSKIGESFFRLNIEKDLASVIQDSWVQSAQIGRRWPSTLVVTVTERKPIAVVGSGKGDLKLMDSSNQIIDDAKPNHLADLPIILGTAFVKSQTLRQQALDLYKGLPQEGVLSQRDVSNVEFDDERGFQLRLTRKAMLVDLGKEEFGYKIDRARRVVQYLDQHQIDALRIDADYAKKVLVKVRSR